MVAWIIYNRDSAAYNKQYIRFYMEEGQKLGIEFRLILVEELEFGVRADKWFLTYHGRKLEKPDFAVCRAIYPLLSRQLEYMGIRVFNNSFTAEICNDKARTCQYLARTGIHMLDSSFYKNSRLKEALALVKRPTVVKAVDGHGGSQVFLAQSSSETGDKSKTEHDTENETENEVRNETAADIIMRGIRCSDVVVQPLTGKRHQDLRVYVIGKEIVAAVLRTAKQGFRSNFSLGGEASLYRLSQTETDIVKRIISEFDFGLVGIDFVIGDQGELIFNEIEDVVGSRMLYQCSDINIVERYLKFIIDKITTHRQAEQLLNRREEVDRNEGA